MRRNGRLRERKEENKKGGNKKEQKRRRLHTLLSLMLSIGSEYTVVYLVRGAVSGMPMMSCFEMKKNKSVKLTIMAPNPRKNGPPYFFLFKDVLYACKLQKIMQLTREGRGRKEEKTGTC